MPSRSATATCGPRGTTLKREFEPLSNTAERLRECARLAGLDEISVAERVVETGVDAPSDMLQQDRYGASRAVVAAMDDAARDAFVDEAIAAVARDPQPLRPSVLVMASRVRR